MTKKDYVAIAKVIHDNYGVSPSDVAREKIALALADVFKLDNPRFDRVRFLVACGV